MSRHLYTVGVSEDAPHITDERFKIIEVDPCIGHQQLWEGKLDLYIDGDDVRYRNNNERSLYALGAVKEYLEKQEILRISSEYEINQAFPLRIEARHMQVEDEITRGGETGSFEDLLEPVPSPEPGTVSPPTAAKTDEAVKQQLEEFRTSGNLPEFEAEFVSEEEILVPSLSRPPIPLAQVVLAFIYVIPIFLVGVFFTSSFMEEKINRKLIVLLSAPVTPFQVISGKMLPYIAYSIIAIIVITLILSGDILLNLAIFIPVSMFIFSALLMVALLYRTFKDQTFFSILAAWLVIAYLLTPAMFTGLSDVSYFSPLTLAIQIYRNESIGVMEYLLATIPLYLLFSVTIFIGVRVFNEEYLMGFRPLHRKVAEAINLVMDRRHLNLSVMLVSLVFIPLVLMIQFASIIIGMNLPNTLSDSVSLAVIFPLAIVSEEIAKSSSVAVLLQNRSIGSWRSVVKYSFFAAFGFFLGEKLLLYLTLSVVSETMFVEAALGSGWLILPLAMHFVSTAVVGLLSGRFGIRFYPLAIAAGAIIHGSYNLIVMRGAIF
ncbi:MAG: ABC transporter permease subunit [Dehalococcoidia bacterium]